MARETAPLSLRPAIARLRSPGLEVVSEYRTSMVESVHFLMQEVLFCLHHFANSTDPTETAMLNRARHLKEMLSQIEEHVSRDFAIPLTFAALAKLQHLDAQRRRIPRLLFEISQCVSNRRRVAGSATDHDNSSRLLRGVHPYYHSSFLGIECFSRYFHHLHQALIPTLRTPSTPILDLWASDQYAWDPTVADGVRQKPPVMPYINDEEAIGAYQSFLQSALDMTTLRVPRWACYQLRHAAAFLPHEYFHRAMGLAKYLGKDHADAIEDRVPDYKFRPVAEAVYGTHVFDLYQLYCYLISDLGSIVYRHLWLWKARFIASRRLDRSTTLRSHIESVAEELLADAFAFYVTGPAFIYSLGVELLPALGDSMDDSSQDGRANPIHNLAEVPTRSARDVILSERYPHPALRLISLLWISRMFDDPSGRERIRRYLIPLSGSILDSAEMPTMCTAMLESASFRVFLAAFQSYLGSMEYRLVINTFFNILRSAGIPSYCQKSAAEPESAADLDSRLDALSHCLDGACWDYESLFREYSPVDLLLAVWNRKFSEPAGSDKPWRGTGYQSEWRLYLEYRLRSNLQVGDAQ